MTINHPPEYAENDRIWRRNQRRRTYYFAVGLSVQRRIVVEAGLQAGWAGKGQPNSVLITA